MKFYPEGHLIDKAENKASMQTPAALSDAMRDGKILEARSIICDNEHNLIVDLQMYAGHYPARRGRARHTRGHRAGHRHHFTCE